MPFQRPEFKYPLGPSQPTTNTETDTEYAQKLKYTKGQAMSHDGRQTYNFSRPFRGQKQSPATTESSSSSTSGSSYHADLLARPGASLGTGSTSPATGDVQSLWKCMAWPTSPFYQITPLPTMR
ncbi:hypothetical protein HYALB_00010147 [Hymenoscyphus albidus]|uniref:Uncharacterized protein n=1 Tax=Hymenoscyphus albidus TaxID=595503 RepID=A0A9N9M2I6_9HELO|nr:hypothetical protein HYALB_00010147 [Hymenoscyphus albidus]